MSKTKETLFGKGFDRPGSKWNSLGAALFSGFVAFGISYGVAEAVVGKEDAQEIREQTQEEWQDEGISKDELILMSPLIISPLAAVGGYVMERRLTAHRPDDEAKEE